MNLRESSDFHKSSVLVAKEEKIVCRKLTENAIVFNFNKAIHTHNYLTAACHLYDYGNIDMLPICLLHCILSHFVIALDMSTNVIEWSSDRWPTLVPCVFLTGHYVGFVWVRSNESLERKGKSVLETGEGEGRST